MNDREILTELILTLRELTSTVNLFIGETNNSFDIIKKRLDKLEKKEQEC